MGTIFFRKNRLMVNALLALAMLLATSWENTARGDPAINCRNPQFKFKVEPFPDCEAMMSKFGPCALFGPSNACKQAKEEDKKAVKAAEDAYNQVCDIVDKIKNSGSAACERGTDSCFGTNSTLNTQLSSAIARHETALNERKKAMDKAMEEILSESDQAMMKGGLPSADGMDCQKDAHGLPDPTGDETGKTQMSNADQINSEHNRLKQVSKGNEAMNNGEFTSQLFRQQADVMRQIRASQKKIQQEITNLKKYAAAATAASKTNKTREEKIGGNSPKDQSTITGNTKPSEIPAGGAPPQQQGGGGSPPGGGDPGGSGGSSLSSQTPSNLKNPVLSSGLEPEAEPTTNNGVPVAGDNSSPSPMGIAAPQASGGTPAPRSFLSSGGGFRDRPTPKDSSNVGGKSGRGSPSSAKAGGGSQGEGAASGEGAKDSEDAAKTAQAEDPSSSSGAGGFGGGGGSGAFSDDTLTPFGQPLGDPKFSLAGSDTDAQIRRMLGEFGNGDEHGADGRSLASLGDQDDGIGDRNGPSLFERCRESHLRCQQRGCVTTHGGSGG